MSTTRIRYFSGFGHELAQRLDEHGCIVFATCLHPGKNGASELNRATSKRVHVIPMDVGSDKSVTTALKYIQKHCPKEGKFNCSSKATYTRTLTHGGLEDVKYVLLYLPYVFGHLNSLPYLF